MKNCDLTVEFLEKFAWDSSKYRQYSFFMYCPDCETDYFGTLYELENTGHPPPCALGIVSRCPKCSDLFLPSIVHKVTCGCPVKR